MVTVNGLSPSVIPSANKAKQKRLNKKQQDSSQVAQTTKVAEAVAHSIRQVKESDIEKAQLQYDLPQGQSRKAMEEYMDVLNQSRKEELAQLIGVDIYI